MTREETIKVLSILKVAYPNAYRGMTKQEGLAVVALWSMQFADTPSEVVTMALHKLISKNTFAPTIAEIKEKIKSMYYEISEMLLTSRLTKDEEEHLMRLQDACAGIQTDLSALRLIGGGNDENE